MQKTLICLWSGTSTGQNVIIAACSNLFNEWRQDAREASEISYTLVMAALLVWAKRVLQKQTSIDVCKKSGNTALSCIPFMKQITWTAHHKSSQIKLYKSNNITWKDPPYAKNKTNQPRRHAGTDPPNDTFTHLDDPHSRMLSGQRWIHWRNLQYKLPEAETIRKNYQP